MKTREPILKEFVELWREGSRRLAMFFKRLHVQIEFVQDRRQVLK